MDFEIVRPITSYVIGSGKRCTMKRRDALFAALALLIAWQILAMIVNLPILPAPLKVVSVFIQELQNGLLNHFGFSLWRVFAGMALSVLIAAPVGLAIGGSKTLNRIFSPLIYLLYPIPMVVFVPVVVWPLPGSVNVAEHSEHVKLSGSQAAVLPH